MRRSEEISRRNGLTPRQYVLLLMIGAKDHELEPATITDLVERMALTQSTVTELVQRAEEAGLVRRDQADHDGRVAHLTLTPDGERKLAAVHEDLRPEREALAELFTQLG